MKYETKIESKPLSKIYEKLINEDWELDYYDKEESLSLWKRKIKRTKVTKPPIEDTIMYMENKDFWKRWSDKLKESYKEFRTARWQTHKDYVSPLAEKKLLNIVNKYSESISIKLMADSLGYKSIVEKQDIIEQGLKDIHQAQKRRDDEEKQKEQEKLLWERMKAEQAIKESWKPKSYWEDLSRQELKQEYPTYTDTMLDYQVNPRIRIILKREGFL